MVTEQQILDELKRVLEEAFKIDPAAVVPEAKLYDDLDLDSIDAVDLIVKLRPFIGEKTVGFQPFDIPLLSDIPVIGQVLFQHDPLVYISYILPWAVMWFFRRTSLGLALCASGESPEAVQADIRV